MTLIKSISGIRGTIGGTPGDNLTPIDIAICTAAYGQWIGTKIARPKVVLGRDARISGGLVSDIVIATLRGMGIDVIDIGLSTTPTVELMVPWERADGGIIITASHNPKDWNALKFLNSKGEFISSETGRKIVSFIDNQDFTFCDVTNLGSCTEMEDAIASHITHIHGLPHVDIDLVRAQSFKIGRAHV